MSGPPLGAILYARGSDGRRVYADSDVAYALPLLVFMLQIPPGALPPPVQQAFLEGCALCGLTGEERADEIGAKIGAAYAARPIAPALLAALDVWARAGIADDTTPDEEKKKLHAFLGMASGAAPARAGANRGVGALARFAVASKPVSR